MHKRFLKIALCSALITVSGAALADTPQNHNWWVNFGSGIGGGNSELGGLAGTISANYQLFPHQLISARILKINNLMYNDSNFTDIGIMYGLMNKFNDGYVSASAGLSYARYEYDQRPLFFFKLPTVVKQRMGIPIEAQAFVRPFNHVGFGIIGFGNINSAKNVFGAALAIQVGSFD